jgi:hypothetical protein
MLERTNMGILNSIFGKIFGSKSEQAKPTAQAAPQAAPTAKAPSQAAPQSAPQAVPSAAPAAASQPIQIDVSAVLDDMAKNNPQKLNWRTSIVDLMKLLGIDSSLTARKELATELDYNGDQNDSAAMNIWLHKQVMNKLAANGGKVPDELRH